MNSMLSDNKVYFKNLNGLRFIAALIVIVGHQEQIKKYYLGLEPFLLVRNPDAGQLGVIMFFVLSGFLISYLLLEEEAKSRTISIKNFYIRRILRI